uniref:Uncharacterized protein n=1 Tax=Oryza glumipatula TaxID=40148 RepID=A0A0D9ZSG6_9ORYZ
MGDIYGAFRSTGPLRPYLDRPIPTGRLKDSHISVNVFHFDLIKGRPRSLHSARRMTITVTMKRNKRSWCQCILV